MSFTDVFGSSTLPPSEYGYRELTLTGDATLVWPYNVGDTDSAIAKITEFTCLVANSATLPDATQVSVGEDFLLRNVGSNALTVKDAAGATIATVGVGEARYFYLTDNTTAAGLYGVVQFGVGTSTVDAGTLVGYGVKAIGATLNQSHPALPTSTGVAVDATYRSKLVVFTGGVGTFTLSPAATLGDDFFFLLRNDGTGTITINPNASELIDGQLTLQLNPGESLILVCTGVKWYSVGYGRSVIYNFTQLTKDVSAGGTITLTASEASNKLITITGNPSVATTVIVPAVVAVYYLYSILSTATTVTFKTASGAGVSLPQSERIIAICDGTNLVSAQSAVANSSVSLIDGGVTAPSLFFSTQTNTGLYKYGSAGVGVSSNGTDVASFVSSGSTISSDLVVSGSFTGSGAFLLTGDVVQVNEGGTGANNSTDARTNLGIQSSIESAIQSGDYVALGSVSGATTITATATPTLTAYDVNQSFRFFAAGVNVGASTLNIDGLGAKSIKKASLTGLINLGAQDIPTAGAVVSVTYDGTQFIIGSPVTAVAGATTASSVTFLPSGSIVATDVQSAIEELDTGASGKQDTLVSGTNIKTVNSTTLLGSGNLAVGDVTLTGTETLTNKTLTGYTETQYSLTGTDLAVSNGTVQYKTLSGNTTFTESLADGQGVILMLNPSTFTTTWFTCTWIGTVASTAPTLIASVYNCLVFFQMNGTLYGRYVGRV